MNKKLQKQIKTYAGVASVILAADKANGQVVYVDIDPDSVLDASSPWFSWPGAIVFDMNQDGQNDIQFFYYATSHPTGNTASHVSAALQVGATYNNNNNKVLKGNYSVCGTYIFSYFNNVPNALPLNQGDSIPSANQLNNFEQKVKMEVWHFLQSWGTSWPQLCFNAMTPLNQDDCIGVKFIINGQFHYGWFKIELLNKKIKIKEYAYQLQPNVPLLACDTTSLAAPPAFITPQGPLSFCSGGSVLLSANAGAGLSYQWKRYGIPISGATAQNYLATAAGKYRVVVTNTAGSNTSPPVIVTVPCFPVKDPVEKTGMEISDRQISFSQQNNSFHISFFENLNALSISVYDLIGKEIFKKTFSGNEASFTIEKKGIYFAEVKSEKGVFRKKVFIY